VGKAGEQRLVLDLRDEALMASFMRIAVQQMMQLRRDREREDAQPERKHQPGGSALAGAEWLLSYNPKLHCISKEHIKRNNARAFCGQYPPSRLWPLG
jgi:hypothetical protein